MSIHWWTLIIGLILGATVLQGVIGGLFSKIGVGGKSS